MTELPAAIWNQIAATQTLVTEAAWISFRMDPDQLVELEDHWGNLEDQAGTPETLTTSVIHMLPYLAEKQAIQSFRSQHPDLWGAMPDISNPSEAAHLMSLEWRLADEDQATLALILSSPEALDRWHLAALRITNRPMRSPQQTSTDSNPLTLDGRRKTPLTRLTPRQERILMECRKLERDGQMEAEKDSTNQTPKTSAMERFKKLNQIDKARILLACRKEEARRRATAQTANDEGAAMKPPMGNAYRLRLLSACRKVEHDRQAEAEKVLNNPQQEPKMLTNRQIQRLAILVECRKEQARRNAVANKASPESANGNPWGELEKPPVAPHIQATRDAFKGLVDDLGSSPLAGGEAETPPVLSEGDKKMLDALDGLF